MRTKAFISPSPSPDKNYPWVTSSPHPPTQTSLDNPISPSPDKNYPWVTSSPHPPTQTSLDKC
ncbi:MAG: hypothetical protein AAFR37_24220, partial [Cyanobacteria bacterium J06628_3]